MRQNSVDTSFLWLKTVPYDAALSLQKSLWEHRVNGDIGDTVLFLEHNNTITIGRGADGSNLLVSPKELHQLGCSLFTPDRGGDITYHGPGQLICYPIIDLGEPFPDLHKYLRDLEEVMIRALKKMRIRARRCPGATGVWTRKGKIGAVGVKVTRGVTMHGFSLNVNVDMDWYDRIVACGLHGRKVASLDKIVRRKITVEDMIEPVKRAFNEVFSAHESLETSNVRFEFVPAATSDDISGKVPA